jgi:hypothetical protein
MINGKPKSSTQKKKKQLTVLVPFGFDFVFVVL